MRMTRSAVSERPALSIPSTFRRRRSRRRWSAALVVVVAGAVTMTGTAGPALADRDHHRDKDNAFTQTNLVSDIEGLAAVRDLKLINPWGVAFGPVDNPTPLWTSNQGSNSSTLYTGTTKDNAAKVGLEVAASSPTGIVFNSTTDFVVTNGATTGPARFIFDEVTFNQQGIPSSQITGWVNTGTPNPQTTVTKANKPNSFYTGLALVPAHGKTGPLLLAADNANPNTVDVYDGQFNKVTTKKGRFVDPKYSKSSAVRVRGGVPEWPGLCLVRLSAAGCGHGRGERVHRRRQVPQAPGDRRATGRAVGDGDCTQGLGRLRW